MGDPINQVPGPLVGFGCWHCQQATVGHLPFHCPVSFPRQPRLSTDADQMKRLGQRNGPKASLEIGFARLGHSEITSLTLPINLTSQQVMKKLGFRYERDFEFAGLVHRR
jgi:hypothetical protein